MEHGCSDIRTQDHTIVRTITEALGPAAQGQAHLDFWSPGLTLSQTLSKSKCISSFSSFLFQLNRLLKSCLKNKLNTQKRSQLDGYFSNTQLGIGDAAPTGVECLPTRREGRSDSPDHHGRTHAGERTEAASTEERPGCLESESRPRQKSDSAFQNHREQAHLEPSTGQLFTKTQ